MPTTILPSELREELVAIAEAHGCELLEAEFKAGVLRLVLDRAEGVRLEDCEAVSREASTRLDVEDFGRGRYTLEVSSPGLDRKLYGPADYARFVGRRVRVRYLDAETGRRATVVARLSAFREERGGEIDLTETEDRRDRTIRLEAIQLARLEIEL
ncbi:MAG: ribosome maturation factor RimP [Holophagales bacterium]|nr:ribosome maturation factor RimP [Holophagales bacterium]